PGPESRGARSLPPRPHVAKPDRWQHVERGGLWPAVENLDANRDVVDARLRVFDEHVEIPVLVEDSGVDELELRCLAPAPPVFFHQVRVGELRLRILVEALHVAVCRGGIEIEVALLDVLAVIAFGSGKAEQALLEDRISAVPQREREANVLMPVANSRQTVLIP